MQSEIIQHPARIKVPVCGRRWGKTVLMGLALANAAFQYPGSRSWYVANDYALCMAQMRMMKRSKGFMQFVTHCYAQFPPRFELKNGSEIAFRSADRPDLLLGAGLRLICHDEAARASKDLFWRVLLPMITDTHGTIICGSTYNGRNWFYDLAERGKKYTGEKPNALIKTWVYPTSTGICFQSETGKQDLAELKAETDPLTWKQEFECEPLATIDAVFRYVDQCIQKNGEWLKPSGFAHVVAQDIGRVKDPSAVVVMDRAGNVVFCEQYPLGMLHADQAKRTLATAQKYPNSRIVLDTTGGASGGHGESHIKEYKKVISSFDAITWTVDVKRNMVNRLALDLETKRICIPPHFTELIAQLKLYRSKMSENAIHPTFGPADKGGHDDCVAALMMCAWAREQHWLPSGQGQSLARLMS